MKWINFFHLYQLANADSYIIEEATEQSYKHIARVLEDNPKIKITMNITGCLVLRWQQLNYGELIERIKKLVERGQIELVGSASYHPLLPLIPQKEVKKQIQDDIDILKKHFGENISLKGFFIPEMAYGKEVAMIIKKLGFEWIILDEIAYSGQLGNVAFDKVYQDKASGLKVVFRSRKYSSCYFPSFLRKIKKPPKLVITATDGELYGLRHKDVCGHWEELLKSQDLVTETISDFVSGSHDDQTEKIDLVPCSWESSEEELKNGDSYYLWYHKGNVIQDKIWELADLSCNTVEKFKKDNNYNWARWHLVRGLASCTFWWASAKDFSLIFGPHAWNPDQIERGINELVRAIRSLDDVTTRQTKIEAEKLYLEIKHLVWEKHWAYYWKKEDKK